MNFTQKIIKPKLGLLEIAETIFDKSTIKRHHLHNIDNIFERYEKIFLLKEKIENLSQHEQRNIVDSLIHMRCNRLLGIGSEMELKSRTIASYFFKKVCAKDLCSV